MNLRDYMENYLTGHRFPDLAKMMNEAAEVMRQKGWDVVGYDYNIQFSLDNDYYYLKIGLRDPDGNFRTIGRNITFSDERRGITIFLDEIENEPTFIEYRRLQWRQRLADLASEADELGFAVQWSEMLAATAKQLATNALTAPKHQDVDDEIPF